MSNDAYEIENFKKRIDLVEYAKENGFEVKKKKSWRGTTAMRSGCEVIFVTRKPNGQQVYWSATDSRDSGTIIDFVQRRLNFNLGEVRKELRAWL